MKPEKLALVIAVIALLVSVITFITSSEGPPGPIGLQGIQGVQGPQGVQGVPGPSGPVGSPGSMGSQGIQGIVGPIGPKGPEGPPGPPGSGGWDYSSLHCDAQVVETDDWITIFCSGYTQSPIVYFIDNDGRDWTISEGPKLECYGSFILEFRIPGSAAEGIGALAAKYGGECIATYPLEIVD